MSIERKKISNGGWGWTQSYNLCRDKYPTYRSLTAYKHRIKCRILLLFWAHNNLSKECCFVILLNIWQQESKFTATNLMYLHYSKKNLYFWTRWISLNWYKNTRLITKNIAIFVKIVSIFNIFKLKVSSDFLNMVIS